MRLKSVLIENFRAIERLEVQLDPRLNVFVGRNAAGKTAILDAIAIGLSVAVTHFPEGTGIGFRRADLRQYPLRQEWYGFKRPDFDEIQRAPYTRVTLETVDGVSWDKTERRDKTDTMARAVPSGKGQKALIRAVGSFGAVILLPDPYDRSLAPFFTTARSFFGPLGEDVLARLPQGWV